MHPYVNPLDTLVVHPQHWLFSPRLHGQDWLDARDAMYEDAQGRLPRLCSCVSCDARWLVPVRPGRYPRICDSCKQAEVVVLHMLRNGGGTAPVDRFGLGRVVSVLGRLEARGLARRLDERRWEAA